MDESGKLIAVIGDEVSKIALVMLQAACPGTDCGSFTQHSVLRMRRSASPGPEVVVPGAPLAEASETHCIV